MVTKPTEGVGGDPDTASELSWMALGLALAWVVGTSGFKAVEAHVPVVEISQVSMGSTEESCWAVLVRQSGERLAGIL